MTPYLRSFRLVCPPADEPVVEAMLRGQGYAFEPDPLFGPARRLTAEPRPLGSSLAAFFGLIYIQDRASMLPPVALAPDPGMAVLDMCASPGSKTGQLAGMVGPGGLVLGNEPSPARLATLRRNLHAMGLAWTVTCCRDGENLPLPDAGWDAIQLDPPCSGWGTVERNPRVREIWKDDRIPPLIRLQRALLREAVRLLRPGGALVYSTCTTNVEENEAQVRYAMDDLGLEVDPLPDPPGVTLDAAMPDPATGRPCEGVWRLSPRRGDSQGFFVARLRLPGREDRSAPAGSENTDRLNFEAVPPARLADQGMDPGDLPGPVGIFGDSLHVLPDQALSLLPAGLRWQGMYLGKISKGGDIRPSPRLRLPPAGPAASVELEGSDGLAFLEALLAGRSAAWEAPGGKRGGDVPLRWNGLLLGRARIKNRRLLWSER